MSVKSDVNEKLHAKEVIRGQEFIVECGTELRYRIRRNPTYWQVFDSNGNLVGHPDQYLNDILDRLGCLARVEYIVNWQKAVANV